jgi:hypothetical protein
VHYLQEKFAEIGLTIPEILLPNAEVDLEKWAVVACDQFTSEREYWRQVKDYVNEQPSTLHLIFPEVYLEDPDTEERIAKIRQHMTNYLASNTFCPQPPGFIYVDRRTPYTYSRKGLIVAVDLEHYDYRPEAKTLIRATEGTILDRLPPRIKIREGAPVELPHIMVLIDDPEKTVIEPLSAEVDANNLQKLYDFDLMLNSGHLRGYLVNDERLLTGVLRALQRLTEPAIYRAKYQVEEPPLLFAVGDGNHSLATAKAVWERIKEAHTRANKVNEDIMNHPARYALVELVNLYDEGLVFEPIHRVLFSVDPTAVLEGMKNYFSCEIQYMNGVNIPEYLKTTKQTFPDDCACRIHLIGFVSSQGAGVIKVQNPAFNLEVGTLQSFLDDYLQNNKSGKIDYIHGDEVVTTLGSQPGNLGFYLPVMDKRDLFTTVILDGALPRKTFSMGEAVEKRFYLESRIISQLR